MPKIEVNSLLVQFSVKVSPYHNGSMINITYSTPGMISKNKVDFKQQIIALNQKFEDIVNS